MNQLPKEIKLHIFTYINVLSTDLKPLLEINRNIRNLLYYDTYTLDYYPNALDESIACVAHSYLDYLRYVRNQRELMELFTYNEEEEIETEIELTNVYLNFPPF